MSLSRRGSLPQSRPDRWNKRVGWVADEVQMRKEQGRRKKELPGLEQLANQRWGVKGTGRLGPGCSRPGGVGVDANPHSPLLCTPFTTVRGDALGRAAVLQPPPACNLADNQADLGLMSKTLHSLDTANERIPGPIRSERPQQSAEGELTKR